MSNQSEETKLTRDGAEAKLDELQKIIQKWCDDNAATCVVGAVRHKIEVSGKLTYTFGMVSAGESVWDDALLAWAYGVANERRRYLIDQYKVLEQRK